MFCFFRYFFSSRGGTAGGPCLRCLRVPHGTTARRLRAPCGEPAISPPGGSTSPPRQPTRWAPSLVVVGAAPSGLHGRCVAYTRSAPFRTLPFSRATVKPARDEKYFTCLIGSFWRLLPPFNLCLPVFCHTCAIRFLCFRPCAELVHGSFIRWLAIPALPASAATGGGVAVPSRSPEEQTELRRKIYRAELAREQLETQVCLCLVRVLKERRVYAKPPTLHTTFRFFFSIHGFSFCVVLFGQPHSPSMPPCLVSPSH